MSSTLPEALQAVRARNAQLMAYALEADSARDKLDKAQEATRKVIEASKASSGHVKAISDALDKCLASTDSTRVSTMRPFFVSDRKYRENECNLSTFGLVLKPSPADGPGRVAAALQQRGIDAYDCTFRDPTLDDGSRDIFAVCVDLVKT